MTELSLTGRVDAFRSLRAQAEASVLPLATSLDGRRFSFQARIEGLELTLGGYVMLEGAGGATLGQVRTQRRPRGIQPATLDEYCALRHVMVSQRAAFHSPIDEVLAGLQRSRQVVAVVPSYNQVALVLTHTECVATLPSQLLERYADTLDILPLPFEVPHFNLAMAWHPRAQHDDALRWLRDSFLEAMPPGDASGA